MADVLSRELIDDALTRLPDWSTDGTSLTRSAPLGDTQHAQVAAKVEEVQTAMNHHADVSRDGGSTSFVLSTHSEGGITVLDLTLASEIDNAVRAATGTEPPRPPDEVMAEHTMQHGSPEQQQAAGEKSRERTADVVSDVQGTEGQAGTDNNPTATQDGGGAHRAPEPTGHEAAHREVWPETSMEETTTSTAAGRADEGSHAEPQADDPEAPPELGLGIDSHSPSHHQR